MYEIAITFWAVFGGAFMMLAIVGGAADALFRSRRSASWAVAVPRLSVVGMDPTLKAKPLAAGRVRSQLGTRPARP